MATIGVPIAFYGLYKQHRNSSDCKELKKRKSAKLTGEKDFSGINFSSLYSRSLMCAPRGRTSRENR